MTIRTLLALALLTLFIRTVEAEEPDFTALGQEVVSHVRDELYDPAKAARWAGANDRYAEGIRDGETFRRETRRRLAELGVSHTEYYTPDDPGYYGLLAIFELVFQKSLEVESLGLGLVEREDGWFVARVFPGSPAETAGLRRGDRIVSADGAPFEPVRSLRGKAGQPVALTVRSQRDGPARTLSVMPRLANPKQEWLEAQKSGSRIVDVRGMRVAYSPLWSCAGDDHRELLKEALQGDLAEAQALVVDLRGGWGGCNPDFVSLFDPKVPKLTRIDREGRRSTFLAAWTKPLVVLIDNGSRSGKEAVSRAFQRHKLGTLVGERTAGAVLAGKPALLSDGSLLYLAVSDVLVDGERLEGVGVTPDVPVASELPYAEGRDPQLDKALEVAVGKITPAVGGHPPAQALPRVETLGGRDRPSPRHPPEKPLHLLPHHPLSQEIVVPCPGHRHPAGGAGQGLGDLLALRRRDQVVQLAVDDEGGDADLLGGRAGVVALPKEGLDHEAGEDDPGGLVESRPGREGHEAVHLLGMAGGGGDRERRPQRPAADGDRPGGVVLPRPGHGRIAGREEPLLGRNPGAPAIAREIRRENGHVQAPELVEDARPAQGLQVLPVAMEEDRDRCAWQECRIHGSPGHGVAAGREVQAHLFEGRRRGRGDRHGRCRVEHLAGDRVEHQAASTATRGSGAGMKNRATRTAVSRVTPEQSAKWRG
jgi:carboxyl-terminal processing protease